MKIYVARHGQTAWNALNKTCGTTDIPLTELGLQQAEELADKVENLGIDLIIASTLIRAQQTAEAVSRRIGVPVITDPRIVEQNYGIYEGKDRKDPGFLENKRHFAYRYPGGGESMMDVAYRIFGFLNDIKEKYPDKTVLVVCHGGVCRLFRAYFEDMTNDEYYHYSEPNGAVRAYEL